MALWIVSSLPPPFNRQTLGERSLAAFHYTGEGTPCVPGIPYRFVDLVAPRESTTDLYPHNELTVDKSSRYRKEIIAILMKSLDKGLTLVAHPIREEKDPDRRGVMDSKSPQPSDVAATIDPSASRVSSSSIGVWIQKTYSRMSRLAPFH
jgi:hypothetical protein